MLPGDKASRRGIIPGYVSNTWRRLCALEGGIDLRVRNGRFAPLATTCHRKDRMAGPVRLQLRGPCSRAGCPESISWPSILPRLLDRPALSKDGVCGCCLLAGAPGSIPSTGLECSVSEPCGPGPCD